MAADLERQIVPVPPDQLRVRKVSDAIVSVIYPHQIRDTEGSLDRATEAAKNGQGLIIVFAPHWCKDDGFRIAKLVVDNPVLRDRELLFPLAKHQERRFFELVEQYEGIQYPKIVTNDTIKAPGYEKEVLRAGLGEYTQRAHGVLAHGGVVPVALQGKREPFLDPQNTLRPLGELITALKRQDQKNERKRTTGEAAPILGANYGVLLVALEDEARLHYDSPNYHPFTKATLTMGGYYPLGELLGFPEINGDIHIVDAFVREKFKSILPEAYLSAPSDEAKERQTSLEVKRKIALATTAAVAMSAGVAYALHKRNTR